MHCIQSDVQSLPQLIKIFSFKFEGNVDCMCALDCDFLTHKLSDLHIHQHLLLKD